jgi:hypothetical protein
MSEPSLKGKPVTVVYEIVDDTVWRATNPLRYEHHGLKAYHVGACDALARCDAMRDELERLRDIVSDADVASIDAVLKETP